MKISNYSYLADGLPTGYVFSVFKPKYPDYAAVPMESGKTGLYKLLKIETPQDPGDMHIPRWEFVSYIPKPKDTNEPIKIWRKRKLAQS